MRRSGDTRRSRSGAVRVSPLRAATSSWTVRTLRLRVHHDDGIADAEQRDRCEIALRIEWKLRIESRVDAEAGGREQQRVAVRHSARHDLRADDARAATDDCRRRSAGPAARSSRWRVRARDEVGVAAARLRDDQPDRLGGISLRARRLMRAPAWTHPQHAAANKMRRLIPTMHPSDFGHNVARHASPPRSFGAILARENSDRFVKNSEERVPA